MIQYINDKTNISANKIIKTIKLLIDEKCTIPFIARYRKEVTENLNEIQIREIEKYYNEYVETEKRRNFILENITKQNKMTTEIKSALNNATSLTQLEDIYSPFKSKRKTKAQIAIENGLEPLANSIWIQNIELTTLQNQFKCNEKIETWEQASEGIEHIIIEKISHQSAARQKIITFIKSNGVFNSKKRKSSEEIKESEKFLDYFDFSEPLIKLYNPKSSHRFSAMKRGMLLKILRLSITSDEDRTLKLLDDEVKNSRQFSDNNSFIKKAINKAYKIFILPSIENEIMSELKAISEEAAINVFGSNLKNLLLAPYLGPKTVVGIDPGIRTGCKVVVINCNGELLNNTVIYPHGNKQNCNQAQQIIIKLIDEFDVKHVAIGNGTYGRETLFFLQNNIEKIKNKQVTATLVSEAGASVYSASEIAIDEFPDHDITVRGAISIARRFQDPLAELVKIDPKSIGVGQYQHDVNQIKLKKSLQSIVEGCVNYVGVDLNTASPHILSFISGIGPTMAKNIVAYRYKNGAFTKRETLLKVGRFTDKIYEQSVGFLRIYNGFNILDSTFIHPEKYKDIIDWCQRNKHSLKDLISSKETQDKFKNSTELKSKLGSLTFNDIYNSLIAPTQDPRKTFKNIEFSEKLSSIDDILVGSEYVGVINNITNFGAFVDIGIKESGLVHISELSNEFVENPLEVVQVGDEIKVIVIGLDKKRRRISLSCKTQKHNKTLTSVKKTENSPKSPFNKLKNLKLN